MLTLSSSSSLSDSNARQLLFADSSNSTSPASSSSPVANKFVFPLLCPGACGWWPPPPASLSANLTPAAAHRFPVAPGDNEGMVELIFAHCKPCPWGSRRLSTWSSPFGAVPLAFCHPCEAPLPTIDYLFLLFHAILPFVVNHVAISYHVARCMSPSQRLFLWTLCQLSCALLESSLAFFGALLLFRPFGELRTFGCAREGKLGEWYSVLNNPVLHYTRVLRCSSELVYPLYSLPFAIYALNLLCLLTIRSLFHFVVAAFFRTVLPGVPFYAALWALPLLALAHAVLSGVLHALFPFIALLVALLHLVVHLSVAADSTATIGKMFTLILTARHTPMSHPHHHTHHHHSPPPPPHLRPPHHLPLWVHLLVHGALFAFALFTLFIAFGAPHSGQADELIAAHFDGNWPLFLLLLCALLPLPTLFFVLTIRLTAPGGIALSMI